MNFKNYINEEADILLEYSKYDIAKLISRGSIPLDPGMMDRLGFLEKDQTAYHVTNSKHLAEMKSNENKKKQISCFTRGGAELSRLPGQPNVLLLLKGTTVIKGNTDIWTLVSTRDRRWLDLVNKTDKLLFLVKGVLQSVANKMQESDPLGIDVYKKDPKTLEFYINQYSNKDKIQMYRLYIREMEAMLNRNYKVLIDYVNNAAEMSYNEVVLTRWKIQEVKTIGITSPADKELFKTLKISYAGAVERRDLSSLEV